VKSAPAAARFALLLMPVLLVLSIGGLLIAAAGHLTEPACNKPSNLPDDLAMVLVCVGAFFFGRTLVDKRDESRDRYPRGAHELLDSQDAQLQKRARRGALATHLALAFFFACGIGALAYETVGVWQNNPWHFDPITHYVRCAKGTGLGPTLLVGATISFFVGHWLWFPRRGGR
jgi:hypothetical protein